VHDLGRVAVSSRVWSTSQTLTPDEREQVRLHPYYTNQVLARTPYLRSIAELASAHHERLDGSGYYRGSHGAALSFNARVLAAADTFSGKTEPRPHRPALDPEAAAAHLRTEAAAGRLDSTAVEAVLAAAGQRTDAPSASTLTRRELEVLRLIARGASTKQVARALTISPKTVDGHLQRIYPKIGVGTRAGATLYAVRSGLVP
jgi:HD-GYP domain-containing protein (c-di-GMP phosphodiesterase class II)